MVRSTNKLSRLRGEMGGTSGTTCGTQLNDIYYGLPSSRYLHALEQQCEEGASASGWVGQYGVEAVLKPESFPIEKIYVPVKRRKGLNSHVVQEIAESILEIGQQAPIHVRTDNDRFVLVEGLHRLEACKALGEKTIIGILVSAETAHHKPHLANFAEDEAARQKMERLRKLRLEKEAAEKLAVPSRPVPETESAQARPRRSGPRSLGSTPKTLSEWLTQQDRDNGRY